VTDVLEMPRPRIDVVVPFRGGTDSLARLTGALATLRRRPGDTITIVDNTPGVDRAQISESDGIRTLVAQGLATPGFARNVGAARGDAEWLVFIDADTRPDPGLLDRYFDPSPGAATGLLAGGVVDEPVPPGRSAAARYAYLKDSMSQRQTFRLHEWGFAQLANAACRRRALEDVGGLREDIRAGEDADLCYRLRRRGWEIERREQAFVVHRNRQTIAGFLAQKALHGSGAAWLESTYPGSLPARRRTGLTWWALRHAGRGLAAAARERDRDRALLALLDPLEQLSFEFGRTLPNRRPLRRPRRRPAIPRG
jgi:GT2 family glycosyltransferase